MEKVKLNIVPKGKKSTCYASQNDNGRVVRFELFNELIPYILDGSETISIKVVRPDSEEILASIENTFEGKAYIDVVFNANMTEIAGVGECEITITDGETVLGSRNFDMNIEIDAYNGRDVIIETASGTLAEFDTEVEDNALEYESSIPYNAAGYTGLRVINTRTAPVYDKTPYLLRKTPSGYGNSCIEKLNGLTVAFNQQISTSDLRESQVVNDVTATNNNNGSFTLNGNASADGYIPVTYGRAFTENHVYFIGSANKNYIRFSTGYPADGYNIVKWARSSGNGTIYLRLLSGDSFNDTVYIQKIDLTQMFGSTIADYIYNIETQTAGAGVSLFKSLFGADYYAFNAGELMSVKTSGRKTVGKNLISGEDSALPTTIRGVSFSQNANGSYKIIATAEKNGYPFVKISDVSLPAGSYILTPQEIIGLGYRVVDRNITPARDYGSYFTLTEPKKNLSVEIAISADSLNVGEYNVFIQLESGSTPTAYEPYNAVTYPLDPDLELRGIPKLDANNKLYGDGDIYNSYGSVSRRYQLVTITGDNITGTSSEGTGFWRCYVTDLHYGQNNKYKYGLCNADYTVRTNYAEVSSLDRSLAFNADNESQILIKNEALTTEAALKSALNAKPLIVLYPLPESTIEQADPYTDPQEARVTEEFIDTRAIPIPVAQDSIYGTDIEYQDIDFNTTIYGGEIDAVNGVLTSEYNSDGSVKPTPEIIDITPTPIPVKAGDNKIFNSANGNQTIRYYNQVEE